MSFSAWLYSQKTDLFSSKTYCMKVTFICFILCLFSINAWGAPTISSISPVKIKLMRGGRPIRVKITGRQLRDLRSVRLVTGTQLRSIRGLSARFDRATYTSRNLIIAAARSLREGPYRAQILADNKVIGALQIVVGSTTQPITVRRSRTVTSRRYEPRIARAIPTLDSRIPSIRRTSTPLYTNYCSVQQGSYPPPQVTSHNPVSSGRTGTTISFSGRDFIANQFCARIGNQYLKITHRTANLINAELPNQRIAGPLYISHGTTNSEYVLEQDFSVSGPPIISSVSPSSFKRGDMVTISGLDLRGIFEFRTSNNYEGRAIKISGSSSNSGNDFISGTEWSMNSDGTQITFRAGPVYQGSINSLPLSQRTPQLINCQANYVLQV